MTKATIRRRRWAGPLAWTALAVTVALMVLGEYLGGITGAAPDGSTLENLLTKIAFASFPAMGALIASRRPDNPIGWLLLAIGAGAGLLVASMGYAAFGLVHNEAGAPGATVAAWFEAWLWFPLILTIPTFLPLLFPTGRLPSRRWRPVAWFTAALTAGAVIPSMVEGRLVGSGYDVRNPIGIASLGDTEESLFSALGPILLVAIALCLASIVFRYRQGSTQERQQLKWVALAVLALLSMIALEDGLGLMVPAVVFPLVLMGLPVSMAVAVLKYRLYEIDRIVSRTLTYGVLTSALAGGYLLTVLVLQALLPVSEDSPLVVAISTLGVVAAFGPLRTRVQRAMDHRFNRSRYDAGHTIEDFGARLRSETDLDSLVADLVAVTHQTMQPAAVSLWLREQELSRE